MLKSITNTSKIIIVLNTISYKAMLCFPRIVGKTFHEVGVSFALINIHHPFQFLDIKIIQQLIVIKNYK